MNKLIIITSVIAFPSCNPFEGNRVLDYKTELIDLVSKIEKYDNGIYDIDNIDESTVGNVRSLDIDVIIKIVERKTGVILVLWKKTIVLLFS